MNTNQALATDVPVIEPDVAIETGAAGSASATELVTTVLAHIEALIPDLAGVVSPSSRFVEDLEMDSLHLTELVSRLEETLHTPIPESIETGAVSPADLAAQLDVLITGRTS